MEDSLTEKILNIKETGLTAATKFRDQRIRSDAIPFHDPIKRSNVPTFKNNNASKTVKIGSHVANIPVNRNVIGTLLAYSTKTNKVLDWKNALLFPLSPIPLSIASGDGCRRTCAKSKLFQIIKSKGKEPTPSEKSSVSDYILDLMAFVRSQIEIPRTFEMFFLEVD